MRPGGLRVRAQLHADHQVARLRLADSQAKQQDATKHCHSRKRAALGIDGFKRDKNDPSVIVFSERNVVNIRTSLIFQKAKNII